MTTPDEQPFIFWDIDHTLINVGGMSRVIYARAFEIVTGTSLGPLAEMMGRTERAIIADTLALNDVTVSDALIDRFYVALGDATAELKEKMRQDGEILPGVRKAVAAMEDAGTVQSLVTGNIRSISRSKLEAFDLANFFDFEIGGYGDDGVDRVEMVRAALDRAQTKYGQRFSPRRALIVGDTPLDVEGAHACGIPAVCVATGTFTVTELAASGAEAVLQDLSELTTFTDVVSLVLGAA